MRRFLLICVLAPALVAGLAGCDNVFKFAKPTDSASDYVNEGLDHLWHNQYAQADSSFTKALRLDPYNADARWGRAKARLRGTGETALTLVSEVSNLNQGAWELPFMNWSVTRADTFYVALQGVMEDLTYIYKGQATNAEITPSAVALDYGAGLSLLGIFSFRDTNRDHRIDAQDISLVPTFSNGTLSIGSQQALAQWNAMPDSTKQAFVQEITATLTQGAGILLAQFSGAEGININDFNAIIDQITNQQGGLPSWINGSRP